MGRYFPHKKKWSPLNETGRQFPADIEAITHYINYLNIPADYILTTHYIYYIYTNTKMSTINNFEYSTIFKIQPTNKRQTKP